MLPHTQTPSLQLMYAIKPGLLKNINTFEKTELCFEDKEVSQRMCGRIW
jgi:hypothetical protein